MNEMDRTLIVVKRTQADPKAIWAGGTPQASLAVPRTWMTPSSAERAISRPFFCLGFENIAVDGGKPVTRGLKAKPDSDPIGIGDHSASTAPILVGGR